MDYRVSFAEAGNSGGRTRSDCLVKLEPVSSGGISIDLHSKVKPMFGDSIETLTRDLISFYGIEDINIKIEDTGALPWVIAARLESAVKQLTDIFLTWRTPLHRQKKPRPGSSSGMHSGT